MATRFDAGWHKRALAGEPEAIERLADYALEPLYGFCFYRVGGRRDRCEEVVQETLMTAIRRLASYAPHRAGGEIFGWLAGLARNEIRRVLARDKATVSLEQMWERMDKELVTIFAGLESSAVSDDILERIEARQMVNATMSQLPPHYRDTLEAKYLLGSSVREIAKRMQMTDKAVESQLTRARNAFKQTFLALTRNLSIEPNR